MVPRLCASSFQSSAGSGFARVLVAGQDGHLRGILPVRDRDAYRRGNGKRTRYARHHLDRDARRPQGLALLAAPAKEERVSPLEPHDDEVFLRPVDHQGLDLVLFPRVPAAEFPAVDLLGFFREGRKDLLAGQLVVKDDIRRVDNLCCPLREEPRATRPEPRDRLYRS